MLTTGRPHSRAMRSPSHGRSASLSGRISTAASLPRSACCVRWCPMDLAGAVVAVTGASRGIGEAVGGAAAAKQARGGLIARSSADLDGVLAALPTKGATATADVADREATIDALAEIERALGPVDVLVANAGIGAYGPFVDMSYEELERVVQVNVLGTMVAIRAVLPGMVARRRGHIVTIGSIAGRIGSPFEAAYSATKFAGVGLTEALAVEVAPYGVAVSLVEPGGVATDFGGARGPPHHRDPPQPISAGEGAAPGPAADEGD